MIRVVVFEDNQSLRIGLYQLINSSPGLECVAAFENCMDLVKHIKETKPDVVLMDIGMPGISGIEAVKILREHFPDIKILMQTIFEDNEKIFQSILAGASGYILKDTSSLRIIDFIKETYAGGAPMSPSVAVKVLKMVGQSQDKAAKQTFNLSAREHEILNCLVQGMSYKSIAEACFISVDTVRGHIRRIYEKLHVNSKGEAITTAIRNKIIEP